MKRRIRSPEVDSWTPKFSGSIFWHADGTKFVCYRERIDPSFWHGTWNSCVLSLDIPNAPLVATSPTRWPQIQTVKARIRSRRQFSLNPEFRDCRVMYYSVVILTVQQWLIMNERRSTDHHQANLRWDSDIVRLEMRGFGNMVQTFTPG
jgi:hypothetical protein